MSRFATFLTVVLLIWAAMHSYVFWRISTVPWVSRNVPWWGVACAGLVAWLSFPISRMIESRVPEAFGLPLEYTAANWIGVLFLLMCCFLAADVLTLGGFLWPSKSGMIRSGAACVALVLSLIALIQGHRAPAITEREVVLEGLPAERNGTVLVAFSDIHLGGVIRERWLSRMVQRVNDLKPDIIVAVGDVVDGDAERIGHMSDTLGGLKAPLGLWAVTGNHDYYAGVERSVAFMQKAGFRVLRDESAEVAPGLVLAGIDDLTARMQFGASNHPIEKALANRPEGATILLSHTPWGAEPAAAQGAKLMLCGHTHNGQIWPFAYVVRSRYPLVCGLYEVQGLKVLVGRGTATWGPRMRLWQRGEILKISLRAAR